MNDMFALIISILIIAWCVYMLYLTNDAKKHLDNMLKICDNMLKHTKEAQKHVQGMIKNVKNIKKKTSTNKK